MQDQDQVVMHIGASCRGNPGPGGYAAVLSYRGRIKELSSGYRLTTNARLELAAAIAGLKALTRPCHVLILSRSSYLVNSVSRWLHTWTANSWTTVTGESVKNTDRWIELLFLLKRHEVEFEWVKGGNGGPPDARAVALARQAASLSDLPPDFNYEFGGIDQSAQGSLLGKNAQPSFHQGLPDHNV